jgi:hypothetical protein
MLVPTVTTNAAAITAFIPCMMLITSSLPLIGAKTGSRFFAKGKTILRDASDPSDARYQLVGTAADTNARAESNS